MKTTLSLRQTLLATFGLTFLAAPTLADGLDKSLVPADSRIVAHLDIDALKATRVFREIRERSGGEFDENLDEMREELGVDPLEIFHSITVVSPTIKEESGALIVRGTRAIDDLLARLQQEEGYRSISSSGLSLHTWGGESEYDDSPIAYIHTPRGSDERIVVLSNRADMVVNAVRVLKGDAPNLSRADRPALKANPKPGTVVYAEIAERLEGVPDFEPISKVARMMRSLQVQIGENRGMLFLNAMLETESGEAAAKIGDIVSGAKALVSLAAGGEVPMILQDLLDALQVNVSGTFVTIDLSYDSATLIEELDALDD
ncbi:MAG: hypothetical protein GY711_18445 [bacterium]|nr:hypothetical protein [bacterium]